MTAKANIQGENGTEVHKRKNTTVSPQDENGHVVYNANGKQDSTSSSTAEPKSKGLTVDQVPPQFREMFILSGYRRPYSTAKECFLSVFQCDNNECCNVWTHLIPLLYFVIRFGKILSGLSLQDPYNYPLVCFATSICGFCLMSCGAHTFNAMSPRHRHVCFFFDYAAIAVYCFGASQAFFFYARPASTEVTLFISPGLYLAFSATISLAANFLCCASRHRWLKFKYIVRTMPFVVAFAFIFSPVVWRMFTCEDKTDCNPESLYYHKRHTWLYLFSALINVARLPERLTPGTFDFVGNSHHFVHIFTALGASDEFSAIHSDMMSRRGLLSRTEAEPTALNSVGLLAAFAVLNIGIVLYFANRLKTDQEEDEVGGSISQ